MTAPGSRRILGILIALGLLAATVAPVSAGAPGINVDITASQPTEVTAGLPVGYPVTVSNNGSSTVNHGSLSGDTGGAATFIAAYSSSGSCAADVCDVGTLSSGESFSAVFVYQAPVSVGDFVFTATFIGGEGTHDSEGPASHQDTFREQVTTTVVAASQDSTHGYALRGGSAVSTGLITVATGNPHGTTVTVPATNQGIETIVEDLAPTACPALLDDACFGMMSYLRVGNGYVFSPSSPLKVTIRFDYSELPRRMKARDLRVAHIFDDGSVDPIETVCDSATAPSNAPCYVPAQKLRDRDLQIDVFLLHNGNIRGW